MLLNIRGSKLEVTEAIRSYVESKLKKLDKYFENPDENTANVVIRTRGIEQIVEITIPIKKAVLRAEESHKDLYASIDLVIDKLERQIIKNKTRIKRIENGCFAKSIERNEIRRSYRKGDIDAIFITSVIC